MEKLTHWKKNLDSRYISGEDLHSSLKDLKPEMNVTIERFQDQETFDKNTQTKSIKTGFYLKEIGGKMLHKPVILNKTNAEFCAKEFGSDYMEHWIGKPLVLYAKADRRHGFVARFKKYYKPNLADDKDALSKLENATNLDELVLAWQGLSKDEKNLPQVLAKKDELKNLYTIK